MKVDAVTETETAAPPTGFSKLLSPVMAHAVRRANRKDLVQLTSILEQRPAASK